MNHEPAAVDVVDAIVIAVNVAIVIVIVIAITTAIMAVVIAAPAIAVVFVAIAFTTALLDHHVVTQSQNAVPSPHDLTNIQKLSTDQLHSVRCVQPPEDIVTKHFNWQQISHHWVQNTAEIPSQSFGP